MPRGVGRRKGADLHRRRSRRSAVRGQERGFARWRKAERIRQLGAERRAQRRHAVRRRRERLRGIGRRHGLGWRFG